MQIRSINATINQVRIPMTVHEIGQTTIATSGIIAPVNCTPLRGGRRVLGRLSVKETLIAIASETYYRHDRARELLLTRYALPHGTRIIYRNTQGFVRKPLLDYELGVIYYHVHLSGGHKRTFYLMENEFQTITTPLTRCGVGVAVEEKK